MSSTIIPTVLAMDRTPNPNLKLLERRGLLTVQLTRPIDAAAARR
jgi:hypothetical protein